MCNYVQRPAVFHVLNIDTIMLIGDLKDTTLISLLKAAERTFEDAEYGKV